MELSTGKQLALAILFWVLYFLIVFYVCRFAYLKARGRPPAHPDAPAVIEGKPSTRMTVWRDRDQRLRRIFTAVGLILMVLPLLIPLLLKRLFS